MPVFRYGSTNRPTSQEGNVKMSKLLLVLCLLIGTYTANALETTDDWDKDIDWDTIDDLDVAGFIDSLKKQIKIFKEKVTNLVKSAIDSITENLEKAKGNLPQWASETKKKVTQLTKQVSFFIYEALKQMDRDMDEWIADAEKEGVDAHECRKIANEVRHTAINLVVNTTECISGKFEEGVKCIQDIEKIVTEVYGNLTEINDEAAACFTNVDGFKDAMKSFSCMQNIYNKASNIVTDQVPQAIKDIVHLKLVVLELVPQMSYCASKTGIASIKHDIQGIAGQVKNCVVAKINESKAAPAAA